MKNKYNKFFESVLGARVDTFDKLINEVLNEQPITKVGIFPGAFKPPHLGHFKTVQRMASKNDKAYVFVSNKSRDNITVLQSLQLWDLYREILPKNVIIKVSDMTPVKDTYDLIDEIISWIEENITSFEYLINATYLMLIIKKKFLKIFDQIDGKVGRTFVRNLDGTYDISKDEGFVSSIDNNQVKLVDRLDFSKKNMLQGAFR